MSVVVMVCVTVVVDGLRDVLVTVCVSAVGRGVCVGGVRGETCDGAAPVLHPRCAPSRGTCLRLLSHIMYQLDGVKKLAGPRNRHLIVLIGNSKQQVDDFERALTL